MVPNFIDTDNCLLQMFPVSLCLLFCLLDFIRSNTFGIVQKNCTSDQATISRCRHCAVVFFFILPKYFQQYLHDPPDPLKECIYCIDLYSVNLLVSNDEMLSSPYFQGGVCFFGLKYSKLLLKEMVLLILLWIGVSEPDFSK